MSNRKSLREFLTEYNIENGFSVEEASLYETLEEEFEVVQKREWSSHRWYDVYELVRKVVIDEEERFFRTKDYYMTGDSCASDMDLEPFTLESVYEVYPVEVKTIEYR